jgi:hypothetical protein
LQIHNSARWVKTPPGLTPEIYQQLAAKKGGMPELIAGGKTEKTRDDY